MRQKVTMRQGSRRRKKSQWDKGYNEIISHNETKSHWAMRQKSYNETKIHWALRQTVTMRQMSQCDKKSVR